ncbi:hypothetical protein E1286_21655 [Nonomuraea terrae]|uniref:Uncharacterized protein n=1 Tax=Nonomuraea terrae TaxID=2530383 RepID=A0A4R4YRJ8_9ACTN|nr:hypothetical protein [Nonomuraea terrae]TDD46182.1 hypothetical protein E1286_21655 [Nonomuraea terrae]
MSDLRPWDAAMTGTGGPFAGGPDVRVAALSTDGAQPYRFHRVDEATLELHAGADVQGRGLGISCGAALFNVRLAIRMTGHEPRVVPFPDPAERPGLVATVEATPGLPPGPQERLLHHMIPPRRRLPVHGPLPADVLADLVAAADEEGATFVPVTERMACRVPALAVLDLPAENDGEGSHLAALFTRGDGPRDWLLAGQALQRVLLTATAHGLAAAPFRCADLRLGREGPFGHVQTLLSLGGP